MVTGKPKRRRKIRVSFVIEAPLHIDCSEFEQERENMLVSSLPGMIKWLKGQIPNGWEVNVGH